MSSKGNKTDQLTNQADEVIKQSTSSSEPNTISHLSSRAKNIQPKISILSDIIISGPSELAIKSLSGKSIAKDETQSYSLSPISQTTLDVPITIHDSSSIYTSLDCKEITASSNIEVRASFSLLQ